MIYGLGSESESLPGYVVMPDPHGALEAGQPMYGNGFLPAIYQPTGEVNYVRMVPTDDLQGPLGAAWAKELGAKRIYVLDDRCDLRDLLRREIEFGTQAVFHSRANPFRTMHLKEMMPGV